MENGQKTIKNLFDGRTIFNIPKYQRAYTWEKKQIEEFVDDLENQDPDKDYFLGTILFQDKGTLDGFDHIDIVDGQQRITTLIIFMKLLIDQLKQLKTEEDKTTEINMLRDTYIKQYEKYKLHVLTDDNDFFRTHILLKEGDRKIPDREVRTPSQGRLREVRDLLYERLKKHELETLWEFKSKIERMKVLTYSVKDNAEAALIFETTNDRGKSLTNLEKTKSFLMYNTYLASDKPESLLESLQNRFGEIYRNYERISNHDSRLDEDLILRYHCIAFEEWSSSKEEYEEPVQMIKDKINNLIKIKEKIEAENFIERCSRELQESFTIVEALLKSTNSYILDIFALNRAAVSYSLLIKAYKFANSEDNPNFIKVAQLMEIICFRLGIGRYRVDRGSKRLYELARTFNGDFDQLICDLKKYVEDYCPNTDFRLRLLSPNFFKDAYNNDQLYLFWKYENHLRKKEQPVSYEMPYDEFVNEDSRTKLSIDHIRPQNPKNSESTEEESKSKPPITPQEFEEDYLHSIGNLVPASISANSSESNENFDVKYEKYYSRSTHKQQKELKDFCGEQTEKLVWGKLEIDERRKKILKFALGYWNHEKV